MKLKNKKTGEIIETCEIFENLYGKIRIRKDGIKAYDYEYDSLAELNAEWEDILEEPIQVYLEGIQEVHSGGGKVFIDYATAKEAELAVRKLKAWKRLKDKGFRPKMWEWEYIYDDNISGELIIKAHIDDATDSDGKYTKDLDLLFGGEE